jgi:hypothetical protein
MSKDPSTAFHIHEAAPDDSAALAALVRALNQHQGDPSDYFNETTLARDVFGPDACLGAIVAEDASGLIGYAFFHDGTRAVMLHAASISAISMSLTKRGGTALDARLSLPLPSAQRRAAAPFCGGCRAAGTRRRGSSMPRSAPPMSP